MRLIVATAFFTAVSLGTAVAQEAPDFMKETYPDYALEEALGLGAKLGGESAAIDVKTMQLIQLGVAAQVPCAYCVYFHTRAAHNAGASDAEIKAAVAAAGDVRLWSTVLNGNAYDLDAFKAEVDQMMPIN